jgi:hypothetical protein
MAVLIIEGAAGLMKVAAHMTEASAGLKKEVRLALREACKPVVSDIKAAMMAEQLPAKWTSGGGGHAAGGGSGQRLQASLGRRKRPVSEKSMRRMAASSGLRETIAASVGINVGLNPKAPYVKIRVNTGRLPENQRGLPKAIEKRFWRHPVYGNKNAWVQQSGQPFFYSNIQKRVPEIEAKVAAVATKFILETAGRPVV